jgi:hypothetical protein
MGESFPHRNDVRFAFTSFVGGFMSNLRYVCLLAYSGVQHYCVVFCFSTSCVPYVASLFGLSIFDCPFGIV